MNLTFEHLVSQCPEELFLRIKNLKNIPQRPDHHPEKSVLNHLRIVTNRLAKYHEPILSWAGLFHDIGKDVTTKMDDKGVLHAVDHEIVSTEIVKKYIHQCPVQPTDWEMVAEIVNMHMRIKLFDEMSLKKQLEMRRLKSFGYLQLFTISDDMSTLTDEEIRNPIKYPKRLVFEVEPGSEKKEFWDIQKEPVVEGVEPAYFKTTEEVGVFADVRMLHISNIGGGILEGKRCINFPVEVFNRLQEEK
jgi:hypothetical protein